MDDAIDRRLNTVALDRPLKGGESRDVCSRLSAWCAELGFAHVGIAPATTIEHATKLARWLDAGCHGEMSWMARHGAIRIDPRKLLPGAQSIIMFADRYADSALPEADDVACGRIARYAQGDDYHRQMKRRLWIIADRLREQFPGHRFRVAVDTAPIVEREHAVRAGIGYVGKNTMLIDPGVGSYFFLGEIITTLAIEAEADPIPDHCGTCTRCIEACPTDALTPYRLDATRCISYLTIEHRSEIDPEFHRPIGDWIFGCDICQEVCPHNGGAEPTGSAAVNPAYAPRQGRLDLLSVLRWTEEDRRAAFTKSALKRAGLWMMQRNALIAAGNSLQMHDNAELRREIQRLAEDECAHQVVGATARRILAALPPGRSRRSCGNSYKSTRK